VLTKLIGAALVATSAGFVPHVAAQFKDVLERPALPSPHAARSLQNSVALAGERLVSVGLRGHILYSDDRGRSWQQAHSPVSSDLVAVHFPTPVKGWAVGHDGVVLHSADAGKTWALQLDGVRAARRMHAYYGGFAPEGWSAEALGKLRAEVDLLVKDGADKPFLDVWFADEKTGFIVGAFNLILRTDDGGQSWEPWYHRTDNPQGLHLYAIRPVGGVPMIVGEQGLVLRLDPATGHFHALATPYDGAYFGILGTPGAMLVFGLRGNVLRSTDGGHAWQKVDVGTGANVLGGVATPGGCVVLADQAGQLRVSTDEGVHFTPLKLERPMSAHALAVVGDTLVVAGSRGLQAQSWACKPKGGRP